MTERETLPGQSSPGLRLLLSVVALAAIAGPALIVSGAPPVMPHRHVRPIAQRIVPQAELPPVEPVAFQNLTPDDARAFNATVPFSTEPNPAARPFKLIGTDDERARAIDCMTAAVLYEAGDDREGQRAVAQVVINRVRHPAFPKTICGVVFQGSERATGCQFTFTCDGALAAHRWPDIDWLRARAIAISALTGAVYRPVGYSTHYHTDWVVPYWSSSLDKVAEVHTHLFFRWTGWWGTPPAFNRHVSAEEPVIAQLAALSDAHKSATALVGVDGAVLEAAALAGGQPPPVPNDANSFLLTLDPHLPPDAYATIATRTCGDRAYCKVMGWTDKARTPVALPLLPSQIAAMSFSYLRDRSRSHDKALWNCAEFRRADLTQCMKLQVFVPVTRQADSFKLENLPGATRISPPPVATTVKPPADGLTGVRRKSDPPALVTTLPAVIKASETEGR
jgi:spore germination cell wall hydrolase CwlJ-like protein